MAISTDLPGVTVTITINDQALPEHILPDLDQVARTTDRLVEAQSNQVFEIQMNADPSTTFHGSQLAFKIFVDGRYIETPLISQVLSVIPGGWTEKSEGMHVSPGQVRKYHFMDLVAVAENTTSLTSRSTSMRSAISRASSSAPMSTGLPTPPTSSVGQASRSASSAPSRPRRILSEISITPSMSSEPDLSGDLPHPPRMYNYSDRELAELGTIKIVVSHVNLAESIGFSPPSSYSSVRQIAEKGKGKVSQKVGFTAPQKTAAVSTFGTTDVAGVENPVASFIFHYRAKEAIEAFLALSKVEEGTGIKVEGGEEAEVKREEFSSTAGESAPIKEEEGEEEDGTVKRDGTGLEAIPEFVEPLEEGSSAKQEAETAPRLDLVSGDKDPEPQEQGAHAAKEVAAEAEGEEANDPSKKRKQSQTQDANPKSARFEAQDDADGEK
ncbi:uncharacterized protein MYCFIDRAFT_81464 [Pseudocercospora fijiensis CIRAD86]|uniref:DUF7918 domain-containing protein n=1 Tax=Pseudocercospora fijiensis (strain CIRAD86) TaxID=383855 RepID=M3AV97_PSEFD|nr:uncharacterized protein MYCFIDRAFT_81464 [Pseudocercospora fijiensis CIRAD86]EME81407.1 hypothetical protein MYCFIDRAFT_81464 [Pseudocercospora fijiensis CIRAD86]